MIGTQTLAQAHPRTVRHAPLSSHPGFAPALILWCSALLGLPVLAISGASLESWVMAARIDLILPAAAPPLGATARLLLALGFALVGAGIGWVVVRMLRPAPVREGDEIQLRQRDRHPDAPARRPISAHAELGDEGLGSSSAERDIFADDLTPYRTLPEETPQCSAFAYEQASYHVPPFSSSQAFAEPVQTAAPVFAPVFAATAPSTPLTTAAIHEPVRAPEIAAESADAYDMPDIDFSGLGTEPHAPYPSPLSEEPVKAEATPEPVRPALTIAPPPEDDWDTLPPVVSDNDLRRAPVRTLTPVASITPASASITPLRAVEMRAAEKPTPVETPALIGATPVQPRASASERIAHAALGDLSHVELIERLALAIHSREKTARPVAVNDAQDDNAVAASQDDDEDMSGTQASLRSALAGLREVK